VAGYVKTGDFTTNQLFGMSLGQNAIFKSVLAFVGIFTKGIPSLIVAAGSALVSTAKDFPVIFDVDKGELLGLHPLSIKDAENYVKNRANPLQINFEAGEKVTKFEPLDKNMKVMTGDKGAFINVYVNNEPYVILKKEPVTGAIKKID
jgi:hypothetical protein